MRLVKRTLLAMLTMRFSMLLHQYSSVQVVWFPPARHLGE
jgi:hypothetical protein